MTTRLKTRTLNKSNLLPESSQSRTSTQSLASTEAKSLLNSGTLENIEIEYIKNLQTQIYYLELECNYLRDQADKNGSKSLRATSSSRDRTKSAQVDEAKVGKSLENINQMLKETQKNFENEKQVLVGELASLKQENSELKERLENINSERNKTQSNLEIHHQELRKLKEQFSQIESQLDHSRKDNTRLRTEIADFKHQLTSRDTLIKDLQKQVDDPKNKKTGVHELKNTVNELSSKLTKELENVRYLDDDKQRLLKEVASYQQELSDHKLEIQRLNSSLETAYKQNETDLILAKNNASILKSNIEQLESSLNEQKQINNNLKSQIDEYVSHEKEGTTNLLSTKARLRENEDELEKANKQIHELTNLREEFLNKQRMNDIEHGKLLHENELLKLRILESEKKIKELNSTIEETIRNREKQFELHRNKMDALQKNIDEQINYLKSERANNKSLKVQNDSLIIQDQSNQKLIASLTSRINELEVALRQSESKQSEIVALKNELSSTTTQLYNKDDEINSLKQNIDSLNAKLNDVERLKEIENVIQSQRWEEFGALAENMKNLSRSFNKNTNPFSMIGFETLINSNSSSLHVAENNHNNNLVDNNHVDSISKEHELNENIFKATTSHETTNTSENS